MDKDSPAFVLELPSNDGGRSSMSRQEEASVLPPEDVVTYRTPMRDSGTVINDEDDQSSITSSVVSAEEVAPDAPPDYDYDGGGPIDALERGAAALACPAVVAGGVGTLHFNINNGGGGARANNRTSCSFENGLTENEWVESTGTLDDEGIGFYSLMRMAHVD